MSGYTLIWETCILLEVHPGDSVVKIFLFNELKKLQCKSWVCRFYLLIQPTHTKCTALATWRKCINCFLLQQIPNGANSRLGIQKHEYWLKKNKSKVKLLQTSGTEESMHPYLVWKHSTIQILLIDKNIKSSLNSTDLIVLFQNTGLMKLIKYKASNDKKKSPNLLPL